MVASNLIVHELEQGRLELTFTLDHDSNENEQCTLQATFEAAASGEIHTTSFTDATIRTLCPLFAQAPNLLLKVAEQVVPVARIGETWVDIDFEPIVFDTKYLIQLKLHRIRQTSSDPEIADLQRENERLRIGMRALEAKMQVVIDVCLHASMITPDDTFPGKHFAKLLGWSGRNQADVITEHYSRYDVGEMATSGDRPLYEQLINAGLDVNRYDVCSNSDDCKCFHHSEPFYYLFGAKASRPWVDELQVARAEFMIAHGLRVTNKHLEYVTERIETCEQLVKSGTNGLAAELRQAWPTLSVRLAALTQNITERIAK